MSEHDLDKLFKDKLANRQVAFDENAWQEVEKLLDKERPQKKPLAWIAWLLPALLLLSAGGWFAWNEFSTPNNQEKNVAVVLNDKNTKGSNSIQKESEDPSSNLVETAGNKGDAVQNELPLSAQNAPLFSRKFNINSFHKITTDSPELEITNDNTSGLNSKNIQPNESNEAMDKLPLQFVLLTINSESVQMEPGEKSGQGNGARGGRTELGIVAGIQVDLQNTDEQKNHVAPAWPVAGISAKYHFAPGLTLGADVIYHARTGIANDTTISWSSYDFGENREQITLSTNRMHYIGVPVYVNLSFLPRHGLTAGIQYSYLVNASATEAHRTDFPLGDFSSSSSNEWGHTKGLRKNDFQLLLGYQYQLSQRLQLNLRGAYGLTDVTEDSYSQNSRNDHGLNLQLSLHYRLFNF